MDLTVHVSRRVPAADAGAERGGVHLHHPVYHRGPRGRGDGAAAGLRRQLRADPMHELPVRAGAQVPHGPGEP